MSDLVGYPDDRFSQDEAHFMFQIRFWKTDDPENTRKVIEIKRNAPEDKRVRRDKDRVKREVVAGNKERWTVKTLYPYCNVSMDIVAVNTFYESNASNVIEINTPEGGRLSWLAVNKDNIKALSNS